MLITNLCNCRNLKLIIREISKQKICRRGIKGRHILLVFLEQKNFEILR